MYVFVAYFLTKSFMLSLKSSFWARWHSVESIAKLFNPSGSVVWRWRLQVCSPFATVTGRGRNNRPLSVDWLNGYVIIGRDTQIALAQCQGKVGRKKCSNVRQKAKVFTNKYFDVQFMQIIAELEGWPRDSCPQCTSVVGCPRLWPHGLSFLLFLWAIAVFWSCCFQR